ncbi:MAG: ELM1/GtrOC1 family putative glycosyltransferase [Synergistes sp.]|nr:ELM1/GtrOC1 family putative glycosyltransferase [Synergistes sp.]
MAETESRHNGQAAHAFPVYLKVILILSDGIRGHINQSRGIAHWLSVLTGAEVLEINVPKLSAAARARVKSTSKSLRNSTMRDARDWLASADGDDLVRVVGNLLGERGITANSGKLLIISAGSAAAPYNLALAYVWRCACATVMTPSVIGTAPFDYAIVPEHDFPKRDSNILVTLGAPNNILKENLKCEAETLLAKFPPKAKNKWSVLIGGDDANYTITPQWLKKHLGQILNLAARSEADVYITTSRRTKKDAEKTVKTLASHSNAVRYLLIASEDDFNPIPAMLGFSDTVFCTDDSVNMVSETITGGHRAVLMRTERKGSIRKAAQSIVATLVNAGAMSKNMLWGIPKFDLIFDHFAREGRLIEYESWLRAARANLYSESALQKHESVVYGDFNEAKRAAEWICANWRQR